MSVLKRIFLLKVEGVETTKEMIDNHFNVDTYDDETQTVVDKDGNKYSISYCYVVNASDIMGDISIYEAVPILPERTDYSDKPIDESNYKTEVIHSAIHQEVYTDLESLRGHSL